MFIQLTDPNKDDIIFKTCIAAVKKLFWQDEVIEDQLKSLPHDLSKKSEKERLEIIDKTLDEISQKAGSGEAYQVYNPNTNTPEISLVFPFLERYHRYFLRREWREPYSNPYKKIEEFKHLAPPGVERKNTTTGRNYSANIDDFHHFTNVVSALARLIRYFSDAWKVRELFEHFASPIMAADSAERLSKPLPYTPTASMRKFKLMLGGFFHDIGKTVARPRHGMEGSIILAFHTSQSRYLLNEIVKRYIQLELFEDNSEFIREDLFYISNLVLFHDQYGTIQTGEDNYLRLSDMITELVRYTRWQKDMDFDHVERSKRCLFDLWLLNVADIMVSMKDKKLFQIQWLEQKDAEKSIREFFSREDGAPAYTSAGTYLIQDLILSMEAIESYFHDNGFSDACLLEKQLHNFSRRNSLERIRRLIVAAIINNIPNGADELLNKIENLFKDDLTKMHQEKVKPNINGLQNFLMQLKALSDEDWDTSIIRAIQSVADVEEFCTRLAWIGKMDYALGFFGNLGAAALKKVGCEILDNRVLPTGWLRKHSVKDKMTLESEPAFFYKIQAQFYADNYAAIVIQILSYLLLREESINRLRNIEFSDAVSRLTEDKYDKLLALEGPFRSRRATQLILQTIYVY